MQEGDGAIDMTDSILVSSQRVEGTQVQFHFESQVSLISSA